jgi:hypothetical protein
VITANGCISEDLPTYTSYSQEFPAVSEEDVRQAMTTLKVGSDDLTYLREKDD